MGAGKLEAISPARRFKFFLIHVFKRVFVLNKFRKLNKVTRRARAGTMYQYNLLEEELKVWVSSKNGGKAFGRRIDLWHRSERVNSFSKAVRADEESSSSSSFCAESAMHQRR